MPLFSLSPPMHSPSADVDFIFEVLDFKAATRSEKERMKR